MQKKWLLQSLIGISFLLFNSMIFSQDLKVRNINFSTDSTNRVIIYYDLDGDTAEVYNVKLFTRGVLSSGESKLIEVDTNKIYGDRGYGKYAGTDRKIIWTPLPKDVIALEKNEIVFEIIPEKISGTPWYYYVGGALLLGGTAAVLTLKPNDDEQTNPPVGFGTPPPRPGK
ncbi:MAG: hypothetical protein IPJ03_01570 [Ignavibacteriales bacterium]|nr:hypothetical protein [Ignavibacteriales bacterium]